MSNIINLVDNLCNGIADPDLVIESIFDNDINIFIYRGTEDAPAFTAEIIRKISPTAKQADAKWRLNDYHGIRTPDLIRPSAENDCGDRLIDNLKVHPNRPIP